MPVEVDPLTTKTEKTVVYARVSNQNRRKEMDYQVNRICKFANERGYVVDAVFKEVASGMNDNRRQFWKMLESKPTRIIVENKDRLTRFGFNYIERLLGCQGCEIVVMNKAMEDETDLMQDLISIVTSFCCRLYGLRRGANKAKAIKKELKTIK